MCLCAKPCDVISVDPCYFSYLSNSPSPTRQLAQKIQRKHCSTRGKAMQLLEPPLSNRLATPTRRHTPNPRKFLTFILTCMRLRLISDIGGSISGYPFKWIIFIILVNVYYAQALRYSPLATQVDATTIATLFVNRAAALHVRLGINRPWNWISRSVDSWCWAVKRCFKSQWHSLKIICHSRCYCIPS